MVSSATVKFCIGCGIGIKHRAPPAAGDGPDLGVVVLDRGDVVAPGDGDAVLGAFELRLQREEVLVRLQVGIVLDHRKQSCQRPAKLALRLLEFLEGVGIGEDVRRQRHLRRLGAGLDHLGQHLALLRGIALHRLDQIGNEVGAALILVQHLAPGGLGPLLQGGDGVDAAAGERQSGDRQSQRTDEDARTRTRQCQHDSLPEQPKTTSATGVLRGRTVRQGLLP